MLQDFCFIMVVLLVVIFGIGNTAGAYTCKNYQDVTGIQTKWVTIDACYIKTDNGWQRWDEYKARNTASNLKDQTHNYVYASKTMRIGLCVKTDAYSIINHFIFLQP